MRTFPNRKPGKVVETAAVPAESKFMGLVHEIHLLDGSGSMARKIESAMAGINEDLYGSKAAAIKTGVKGTYTIFQFGSEFIANGVGNVIMHSIGDFEGYTSRFFNSGSTALYDSIIESIEIMRNKKFKEDKVLLKIMTDGQNNVNDSLRTTCANLIAEVQKNDNFTVTFVGTDSDVKYVTANLNIDKSNTLVHDNTERGVKMSYMKTASASVQYRSAVASGQSVSDNFYGKSKD